MSTPDCLNRLVFGTLTMSPLQKGCGIEEGAQLMARAFAEGVRWVDTAQLYGSYPQIRRALELAGRRCAVTVSTKSAAADAKAMAAAVEEAQQALGVERIDIFLLHAVASREDFIRRRGALEVLLAAREKGTVREVGISTHSVRCALDLAEEMELEVFHLMFNPKGIGITDGTLAGVETAARRVKARGGRVYAMKPLGGGYLREEAQEALAWVRDHPLLDGAAVGMTTPHELEFALRVFRGQPVSLELKARTAAVVRRLFVNRALCDGCGACGTFCEHGAIGPVAGKAVIDPRRCLVCGYCIPRCPRFALRIV